jgi:hypothetical protein
MLDDDAFATLIRVLEDGIAMVRKGIYPYPTIRDLEIGAKLRFFDPQPLRRATQD